MKIYELTPADIALLANMLKRAGQDEKRVRIAWHNPSGLMVKVGEGMWTAPLGRPEQD